MNFFHQSIPNAVNVPHFCGKVLEGWHPVNHCNAETSSEQLVEGAVQAEVQKRKYWHFGSLCGVITLKILNTEKYLFGRADENLHCPVTKGTIANLYSSMLLEEPHLCCCLHSEGEMLKVVISNSLIFKFLQRHSQLCAQVNFPMYKSRFDHTVTKYYILL